MLIGWSAAPRAHPAVRARGRATGTRRPPRVTDPLPAPWRTAVRSGSCLPFGPHASAISASNIAAITASPAATLIASSPSRAAPAISVIASWISSGRSGNAHGVGRVSEANSRYGLHGGPFSFFEVYLVVHPKTYHQAGLR